MVSKPDVRKILSKLKGFADPDPELEQYITPPELAASLAHSAAINGDAGEVVDLGCGTGMLTVACAVVGGEVVGFDVDAQALSIARKNAESGGVSAHTKFVESDVREVEREFKTVVMNPPFSVHSNLFKDFLEASSSAKTVYLVAPAEAEGRIKGFYSEGFDTESTRHSVALPPSMGFHAERNHEVEVGLWRIVKQ